MSVKIAWRKILVFNLLEKYSEVHGAKLIAVASLVKALFAGFGCRTKISAFPVGQSCCSALNSWAAQQRRPTEDTEIFDLRPPDWGAQFGT